MPPEHAARARLAAERDGESGAARIVADYIAGMTDRFALDLHARLCGGRPGDEPSLN
jgi:dGTPase